MRVVGVDGCRAGWISCIYHDRDFLSFDFHRSLGDLVTANDSATHVAVDIPIGLAENEPRRCDTEARKLLGTRSSSVFAAPDRRILEAFDRDDLDYHAANTLSKHLTGKGISVQSYNIFGKISEAEALITPELQNRISEVHPELSFLAIAGHPMRHAKKKPEGFAERLSNLRNVFPNLEIRTRRDARKLCPYAQPNDVLDAAAAAFTALRIASGESRRIPEIPESDVRGLRMEIVF